ncbi:MAG: hypothetical protein R3330_13960, partial [Saprospiraceae bacterium]|nr:hypothetical protein [Saprospiraceae bacterium]
MPASDIAPGIPWMDIKSFYCRLIIYLGIVVSPAIHSETLVEAVRDTIASNPDVQIARDQRNA